MTSGSVLKGNSTPLTVFEQLVPGQIIVPGPLPVSIEDEYIRARDASLVGGREHIMYQVRLYDNEFGSRCSEQMLQFEGSIGRIGTDNGATSSNDSKKDQRVVDLARQKRVTREKMDRSSLTLLKDCMQTLSPGRSP